MPLMPMMPSGDPMSSPSPGPSAQPGPPPTDGGLLGMLGGGQPPQAGSTVPPTDNLQSQQLQVVQQIMAQFQQIEQMVSDLAGMLPGTEQIAQDIMQDFDMWKRQAVLTMAQPSQVMPGAGQMI